MKKGIVFLILLISVICLFGCTSDVSKTEGNPDPESMKPEEQRIEAFLDVEVDPSYDNIIAKTEKESYPLNVEQIICTVQNNNVGKGFYLYEIPFIEQKIDDEWVRLYYNSDRLDVAQWQLCAVEGNTTEPNASRYVVNLADISPKVTPGEYRLVVFTAKKTLYAPFALVN